MRNWLALLLLLGIAAPVQAQWFGLGDSKKEDAASGNDKGSRTGQVFKTARVRWLDKQTNKVSEAVMTAGTPQNFAEMQVKVATCLADYAGVILQDVAWVEVKENGRDAPWFAGWMFNSYPEVATLDHARYDVQLVGCGDKPRRKPGTNVAPPEPSKGEVKDSEAPPAAQGADTESPPAVDGTDPYYVPGVEGGVDETPPPAVPTLQPVEETPIQPMQDGGTQGQLDQLHRMMDSATGQAE